MHLLQDREDENATENKKGGNVNKERRPSMIDKFFGTREGEKKTEKKRKNTNTGSVQGSEGIKEEEETMSNAPAKE